MISQCVTFLYFQFQEAKTVFLKACKRSPSCVSWLGVGIACFRVGSSILILLILHLVTKICNVDVDIQCWCWYTMLMLIYTVDVDIHCWCWYTLLMLIYNVDVDIHCWCWYTMLMLIYNVDADIQCWWWYTMLMMIYNADIQCWFLSSWASFQRQKMHYQKPTSWTTLTLKSGVISP